MKLGSFHDSINNKYSSISKLSESLMPDGQVSPGDLFMLSEDLTQQQDQLKLITAMAYSLAGIRHQSVENFVQALSS
jgi:hypothetical protein